MTHCRHSRQRYPYQRATPYTGCSLITSIDKLCRRERTLFHLLMLVFTNNRPWLQNRTSNISLLSLNTPLTHAHTHTRTHAHPSASLLHDDFKLNDHPFSIIIVYVIFYWGCFFISEHTQVKMRFYYQKPQMIVWTRLRRAFYTFSSFLTLMSFLLLPYILASKLQRYVNHVSNNISNSSVALNNIKC